MANSLKSTEVMAAIILAAMLSIAFASAGEAFETDRFPTQAGEIAVTFIGHGSLMIGFGGTVMHIDPWSEMADYGTLPDADIVLITHHHIDHLDPVALKEIVRTETKFVCPAKSAGGHDGARVIAWGDTLTVDGIGIEAIPAYNLTNLANPGGGLVHPKGIGNGYILSFGGLRIYVAGETELVPELAFLAERRIDIAFVAMDGVYNMTPAMAAQFVGTFSLRILYPYHFGNADVGSLNRLLDGTGIDVRIRNMK